MSVRPKKQAGLDRVESYSGHAAEVLGVKTALLQFLADARQQGKRVAAFGAAAKGSTLLNFCGIDETMVDYVADEIPYKIGKYLPGSCLPIVAPESSKQPARIILIFPGNHKEEIMNKLSYIREWAASSCSRCRNFQILD